MLVGPMAGNCGGIPPTTHDFEFVLLFQPSDVDRLAAEFATGLFIQVKWIRSAFSPTRQFKAFDEQSALKIH